MSGDELIRTAPAETTTPFEAKAATFGAVAGWVPGSDRSRPVNAAPARELDRAWQAVPAERITAELRRSAEAGEAWPGALSAGYLRLFGEQLFPGLPPRARRTLQDALAASGGLDRTSTTLRRRKGRFAHSRADAALHRWATGRAEPLPDALRTALRSADDVALALHGLVDAVCRASAMVFAWTVLLDRGRRPGTPAGTTLRPAPVVEPAAHRVREALRLWPVAWLLSRKVTAATELGGVPLVPGDRLYLCTYLLHRNPDVWAGPGEYRPGRWTAPPEGHKARYLPYGFGSAACVGPGSSPRRRRRCSSAPTSSTASNCGSSNPSRCSARCSPRRWCSPRHRTDQFPLPSPISGGCGKSCSASGCWDRCRSSGTACPCRSPGPRCGPCWRRC
ncbi:cytochrome P450 [Streptomyces sp. MN03-5084-2B]|nr:cytochrome P450 [Streptomyces sp. MN03-5084-2B]